MPKKKTKIGNMDDGLNKLKVIQSNPSLLLRAASIQPGAEVEDPGFVAPEPEKPLSSGLLRKVYPIACDMLCHVFNKESFSEAKKTELMELVGEDLDKIDAKYIAPQVGQSPEAKAAAITAFAVFSQKKADKKPVEAASAAPGEAPAAPVETAKEKPAGNITINP